MSSKNYTSIYNIEEYVLNNIMPLYFNSEEINTLNIGLQGQMTHMISDATEDLSNMVTAIYTEMTPNTALLPSTIYNNAALYRIDDIFATPAKLNVLLLIRETELLTYSEVQDDSSKFIIDKNTTINIDGLQFMFDNDIIIYINTYKGDYKYIVQYSDEFENSLSNDLSSPYIQTIRFSLEDGNYLGLYLKIRQVTKTIYEESIINNQSINYPRINISYSDYLANFEVFYKSADSDEYIQLQKVMKNSAPLEDPFCYYTLEDEHELEITFSSRERYFTPDFNADIKIDYYTSLGEDGNFDSYTGDIADISIEMVTDTYTNNGKIQTLVLPQNGAIGGTNALSFDELKQKVILKFSTVGTIITENDLQSHFADINDMDNVKMLFKKKRDDIYRLFSAFSYYVNRNDVILHTHTLPAYIDTTLTNRFTEDSVSDIIKPGTVFIYSDSSVNDNVTVELFDDEKGIEITDGDFLFVNPFLINIMHEPNNVVGMYLNSVSTYVSMDYTFTNLSSENQFICSSFHVERNAAYGEDSYEFTVVIVPVSTLTVDIIDNLGNFLNNIKTKIIFTDQGVDIGYIDLDFESYETKTGLITFRGYLETDDCLTLTENIRCTNLKDMSTSEEITRVVPYLGTICKLVVFCKEDTTETYNHDYAYLEDLSSYQLTNIYTTIDNGLNLVLPFSYIRTYMEYEESDNVNGYNVLLDELPLISAYDLQDTNNFQDIISLLSSQYNYFSEVSSKLENSYSIDLKFMGTYGKSKMFTTEVGDYVDRLNCKIEFDIYPFAGSDVDILRDKLNMIISDYFENINVTSDMTIKISNLMQQLDSVNEVDYLKFVKINDYDSNIQVLKNNTPDISESGYNSASDLNFIPEYITIRPEDIILNIIE